MLVRWYLGSVDNCFFGCKCQQALAYSLSYRDIEELAAERGLQVDHSTFTKAICSSGIPDKITIDKSGANKAGIKTINFFLSMAFLILQYFGIIQVRQIKYLNNIVERFASLAA